MGVSTKSKFLKNHNTIVNAKTWSRSCQTAIHEGINKTKVLHTMFEKKNAMCPNKHKNSLEAFVQCSFKKRPKEPKIDRESNWILAPLRQTALDKNKINNYKYFTRKSESSPSLSKLSNNRKKQEFSLDQNKILQKSRSHIYVKHFQSAKLNRTRLNKNHLNINGNNKPDDAMSYVGSIAETVNTTYPFTKMTSSRPVYQRVKKFSKLSKPLDNYNFVNNINQSSQKGSSENVTAESEPKPKKPKKPKAVVEGEEPTQSPDTPVVEEPKKKKKKSVDEGGLTGETESSQKPSEEPKTVDDESGQKPPEEQKPEGDQSDEPKKKKKLKIPTNEEETKRTSKDSQATTPVKISDAASTEEKPIKSKKAVATDEPHKIRDSVDSKRTSKLKDSSLPPCDGETDEPCNDADKRKKSKEASEGEKKSARFGGFVDEGEKKSPKFGGFADEPATSAATGKQLVQGEESDEGGDFEDEGTKYLKDLIGGETVRPIELAHYRSEEFIGTAITMRGGYRFNINFSQIPQEESEEEEDEIDDEEEEVGEPFSEDNVQPSEKPYCQTSCFRETFLKFINLWKNEINDKVFEKVDPNPPIFSKSTTSFIDNQAVEIECRPKPKRHRYSKYFSGDKKFGECDICLFCTPRCCQN
ncbi:hypothetical protein HELRODRAFT_169300 [Helobdella robusta]|uniref:Uncharacterized protein n=1 Tax=Helobdella robusta TaxID=6412 RepID=T1F1R1_HELRO|nr:hypothetical protein HELRODRAFT_169300 [Helobdella robusta]ESO08453.1 hypothetical protein HELRODRAFT_169300 [Helobdella robusta]